MSRTTKIILSIGAAVLVFCGLLCVLVFLLLPSAAQNMFSTSTGKAHEVGSQIADYTLPAGYKETMGMDLIAEKIVTISAADTNGPAIILFQINTPYTSREAMEQQLRQSFQGAFNQQLSNFHDVGEHNVTLKGTPTTLTVAEGGTSGVTMRQATGVFKGKGGVALILFEGTTDRWDWKLVDAFCGSIR